jgi:hypothetical protein
LIEPLFWTAGIPLFSGFPRRNYGIDRGAEVKDALRLAVEIPILYIPRVNQQYTDTPHLE